MRRILVALTVSLLALGMMAGPALAHPHELENRGTTVCIPQEPSHVHSPDGAGRGAIANNPNHQGPGHEGALHPIHHFLHWGNGAAAQDSDVTPHEQDPVNTTAFCG